MKYTKYFAGFALAVGLLAAGTPTASAQGYENRAFERQDMRRDYRRIDEMRERVARDRFRMEEARRYGNWEAARRFSADLARDEQALRYTMRGRR
jgi:hypothetical protein